MKGFCMLLRSICWALFMETLCWITNDIDFIFEKGDQLFNWLNQFCFLGVKDPVHEAFIEACSVDIEMMEMKTSEWELGMIWGVLLWCESLISLENCMKATCFVNTPITMENRS